MKRLVALLACAAVALPQDQTPTFKANANLVMVTVFVKDKQGKSLGDLRKSDFEIYENGAKQVLSVFEYQSIAGETLPPNTMRVPATPAEAAAIVSAKPAAERPAFRDRRLLVMYFDLSSMQPADQIRARESAEQFVRTQMTSADLVSLVSFSSRLRTDLDFTDDRDVLLAALKKYENPDLALDATVDTSDPDNPDDSAFSPDDSEFQLFNTDLRLTSLEQAVTRLGSIPEKKALIYYSAGVGTTGVENQAQLRSTVNAAVRANLSFYPVDVRGLNATPPGGSASQGMVRGTGMFSGATQRGQRQSFNDQQDTLYALAADTGGKASLDSNDLTVAVRQAQTDVQSYYLLGYYSTDERRDGRFRKIEVKFTRPLDARIDYRRGYTAPKVFAAFNTAEKERQLEDALGSGDPVTDLPIALEVNWFQIAQNRFFTPVAVKIPGSQIPLAKKGAVESTEFDFVAEVRSDKGMRMATLRDTIKIKLPESRLQSRSLVYDTGFTLTPGTYKLKFLARENKTGKMGTFETNFTLPEFSKLAASDLRHSTVVLGAHREPLASAVGAASKKSEKEQKNHPLVTNGAKLIPSVTHVFRPDQTLRALAEVYDAQAAAVLTLYSDNKKVAETRPVFSSKTVELALPLRNVKPGRYTAQLTLVDAEKHRFSFQRTPVEIQAAQP
jgi:VWFA-related protein